MARIAYEKWNPKGEALAIVGVADSICREYQAQGYDLTLRQVYYQFVARGHLPNNQRSYKRLGDILNRARMAGLLDWDYIVDRTRNLQTLSHWDTPQDILDAVAQQFRVDLWEDQPTRVEVWVEKEALAGVVKRTAGRNDCPWFSCRGYVSQSEVWAAAQRLMGYVESGQNVVILHLGDHDPSGIDMTRDMRSRLDTFMTQDWLNSMADVMVETGLATQDEDGGVHTTNAKIRNHMLSGLREGALDAVEVRRIALNFDQVEEYEPPPNPTKFTDSRAQSYIEEHGYESWELDALPPNVLDRLIQDHIDGIVDHDLMLEQRRRQIAERYRLAAVKERWEELTQDIDVDAHLAEFEDELDEEDDEYED